jgi:hypothetical protein
MAAASSTPTDNTILGQLTIKMGLKDAPAPSEGKSKGPFINGGKETVGKGKGHKSTSNHKDDNKLELMLDGAAILNEGQTAGEYDQTGVGELMSTEVPTHKAESPTKKTRCQQRERDKLGGSYDSNSLMHSLFPDQHSQDGGHRRQSRGADDTKNWKDDHKMGPKEFSSDSLSKLAAVLGHKVMSLSLQTILPSISIFQVDITKNGAAQEE